MCDCNDHVCHTNESLLNGDSEILHDELVSWSSVDASLPHRRMSPNKFPNRTNSSPDTAAVLFLKNKNKYLSRQIYLYFILCRTKLKNWRKGWQLFLWLDRVSANSDNLEIFTLSIAYGIKYSLVANSLSKTVETWYKVQRNTNLRVKFKLISLSGSRTPHKYVLFICLSVLV